MVLVPVIAAGVNENQVGDVLRFALERMPNLRGVHFQPLSRFGRCELPGERRPVTIPRMLRLIEEQTEGQMRAADFAGGGAENPYCSFHASYLRRPDGSLRSLPRRSAGACCCTTSDDSREFVANQWSGADTVENFPEMDGDTASLDAFLAQIKQNTFAVSGMVFQDAYNLDLNRLKHCHICEVDATYGMVPFCAYNLTNTEGQALYRR